MARVLDNEQLCREMVRYLAVSGPATAASLHQQLGISQPAFSRLVKQLEREILVVGRARSTRYAARRSLPRVGQIVPIYEIDETGGSRQLADLHAVQPGGFFVEAKTQDDIEDGFFGDLPYFLNDLRPSGFLGRLIPRQHPELDAPQDISLWSGDHCLEYLTRYGWNLSGDLIVGEEAFRRHLEATLASPSFIPRKDRTRVYPRLADDVLSAGQPGSSAGGEQPKFLVAFAPGPTNVLVKFSPPREDALGQRIADLLVAEHLAHQILAAHGRPAARSDLIEGGGRVFLEVERFDRIAPHGRKGLLSLAALDLEFVGRAWGWVDTGRELERQGRIDPATLEEIRWVERFGQLIANTDMHLGNLSFFTRGTRLQGLAPIHDMLPMLYAPQQAQLLAPRFQPPIPSPEDAPIWSEVCRAAREFWTAVSTHPGISPAFQAIAGDNLPAIDAASKLASALPSRAKRA